MKNTIFLTGGVSSWSWQNSLEYLNEELAKCDGGDITVYIRSGGGSVFEGVDMHNALRAYAGRNNAKVTTVAMGIVASIALFIFLSGDERHAFDNSTLMGHNSSNFTWGDRHDHRTSMELLESIDDVQAKKFEKLQGLPLETIKQNMTHEMWYMGEEKLLESKLVTKIIKTDEHLDMELPEGITTEAESDPVKAQKDFLKAFMKESLEHEEKIDFDHVEQSVKACYGNCNLTNDGRGKTESPKDSVNLNNNKGELSMNEEQLAKLQADYASSQSKVTELSAENERLEKEVTASKEKGTADIAALEVKHTEALALKASVFSAAVHAGAKFNLSAEEVVEVAASESIDKMNTVLMSKIETTGAFVASGGNDQAEKQPTAEQAKKILDSL